MLVETYADKKTLTAALEEGDDRGEQMLRLERLGLMHQLACLRMERAAVFFRRLTEEELDIYDEFLPTFYSREGGEWVDYSYSPVPDEVTELVDLAMSLKLFDDFEIWTPEDDDDPMMVGVIGTPEMREQDEAAYYEIGRWAESELLTFTQIKETVLARRAEEEAAEQKAAEEAAEAKRVAAEVKDRTDRWYQMWYGLAGLVLGAGALVVAHFQEDGSAALLGLVMVLAGGAGLLDLGAKRVFGTGIFS